MEAAAARKIFKKNAGQADYLWGMIWKGEFLSIYRGISGDFRDNLTARLVRGVRREIGETSETEAFGIREQLAVGAQKACTAAGASLSRRRHVARDHFDFVQTRCR
jgi:hypothetical protein